MSLLSLYAWPFLASLFVALLLNALGRQLAARDKTLQSLCLPQGAVFGVLVGVGISSLAAEGLNEGLVFLSALLTSALVFSLSERFSKSAVSLSSVLTVTYLALLAAGHILSVAFPSIELHTTQKYWGDLATVSDRQAQIAIAGALLVLTAVCIFQRRWTLESFDLAILNRRSNFLSERVFLATVFVTISFAVMTFGFLFTLSCLFCSSVLMTPVARSLRVHLLLSSAISLMGCGVGFAWSLFDSRIPTVPAIVLCTLVGAGVLRMSKRLFSGWVV